MTAAALACQCRAPRGGSYLPGALHAAAVIHSAGGSAPVDRVPLRAVFRRQAQGRRASRTRAAGADPAKYIQGQTEAVNRFLTVTLSNKLW